MAGGLRVRQRGRLVIVALGPTAGVAAGGLTNLLTATWNWWLFGGLVLITSLASAGTLIALPRGNPPDLAVSPAEDQPPASALRPPSGTRVFTGRSKELRRLATPVPEGDRPGPLLLVIAGMPGTGKTELAISAARALAARYPDGVFWLGLRTYAATESQVTSTAALRTLLNALNVPPDPNATSVSALSRTWKAATTGKKMLIILDDADTAEQIRPLLPAAQGAAILITTRHVLIGIDPDHSITLQPFTRSQAARLAGAILRRTGLNDPQAVAAIAAAFRIPLAIRQMSDLKAANPAHEISATPAGTISDETSAAFARSLAALAKPARLVLRRVAHYPGSLIMAPIAAVLADQQIDDAATLLATLYQRGLLVPDNRTGDGGYRMHDAVRAAALIESGKHDSVKHLAAADRRLFQYTNDTIDAAVLPIDSSASVTYMSTDEDACRVPPPRHDSDVAALRWLDRHHADLLAVTRRCLSARSPQAWRLVHNLEAYQRMRGFYTEIIELNGQALSLAQHANDLLGQAAMHQNLGLVDMRTSNYHAALARFQTSLELYTQAGNQAGQKVAHHELCNVHKWLGNFAQARAHATFCFEASSGDDLSERAFAHSSLGVLDRLEGSYTTAREHLTRAVELFERAGQRRGVGICHRQLGMLDQHLSRYHDAQAHLGKALFLFQELGDLMNQADTHHNLAVVHRGLGALATAHKHATTALALARQISHVQGQADAHSELAQLAQTAGDYTTAHIHLRHALDLHQRLQQAREAEQLNPSPPPERR
ncbi:tetratricopeptide repeat protein [Nonomuraea sp. NPDC050394]|uniref:tetratricopeptide repeat protein n=1 Tax=Nonomuraea sp. NPDC050394 TaxID=3364363 RepID=UPI0037B096AC